MHEKLTKSVKNKWINDIIKLFLEYPSRMPNQLFLSTLGIFQTTTQ